MQIVKRDFMAGAVLLASIIFIELFGLEFVGLSMNFAGEASLLIMHVKHMMVMFFWGIIVALYSIQLKSFINHFSCKLTCGVAFAIISIVFYTCALSIFQKHFRAVDYLTRYNLQYNKVHESILLRLE